MSLLLFCLSNRGCVQEVEGIDASIRLWRIFICHPPSWAKVATIIIEWKNEWMIIGWFDWLEIWVDVATQKTTSLNRGTLIDFWRAEQVCFLYFLNHDWFTNRIQTSTNQWSIKLKRLFVWLSVPNLLFHPSLWLIDWLIYLSIG